MVLIAALCTWAGFWQLQRAEQRKTSASELAARAQLPALRLEDSKQLPQEWRYRRVIVRGVFEAAGQVLIDNQTFRGQAGYHVITPLRMATGGAPLLVNRGWVPVGPDRAVLPDLQTPRAPVEIRGLLDPPPGARYSLGVGSRPGPLRGARWAYLDLDFYAETRGAVLRPYILLMDPEGPYGFVREWPRFETLYREKFHMHMGYAVQWFVFAGLALAGLVGLMRSHGAG